MNQQTAEYQICKRCVMDTSDSQIRFDEKGICHHCYEYDKNIEALPEGNSAKAQLEELAEKIKSTGRGQEYDCIIGLSGGVDSTYVAYFVKKVLGLRPLAVHLDNGWNSELAVKNIENTVKRLDIDLFTHVIDWEEFKDLQLSFLKSSTPDSEIPTDHAIFTILRKLARKKRVKYVINGINLKTESHHPLSWSQGHSDWKYIRSVQREFGSKKLRTFPHGNFFTMYADRVSKKWVNILNYIDYDKDEAKDIIQRELEWRDYGGKHFESIYTRFYQGYILPTKFGYDKRKMHLSSLICAGVMTRDRALEELKNPPYPVDMQEEDIEYVTKKFGVSLSEFEEIMNLPKKTYYDYPSYYGKILKNKKWMDLGRSIRKLIQKD